MTAQCFEMVDVINFKYSLQPHDLDSLLFNQTVIMKRLVSYSHDCLVVLSGLCGLVWCPFYVWFHFIRFSFKLYKYFYNCNRWFLSCPRVSIFTVYAGSPWLNYCSCQ